MKTRGKYSYENIIMAYGYQILLEKTNYEGIWNLENLSINSKKNKCVKTEKSDDVGHSHMKKLPSERINVQLLRSNARSFKMAAERCLEQRPLPDGEIESPLIPAVTSLVFSIELYIKFLLAKENKQDLGHRLLELFKSLNLTTQNDIVKTTKYSREEFELLLKEHSEIAVEWKYIHIYGKSKSLYVNIEFLTKVINSLELISSCS